MQAHYIESQAYRNVDSLATRPVLMMLNGKVPTSASLIKKLKEMAQMYNVDPTTVVLHGLRIGQSTALANGPLMANPLAILGVTGHKTLGSIETYVRMYYGVAETVTRALEGP